MKKTIYTLLVSLLTLQTILPIQNQYTSVIIASSLIFTNNHSKHPYDKQLTLQLHHAIYKRRHPLVKKLINNPNVDINAKVNYGNPERKGCTPLIWCCDQGDNLIEIVKFLLEHKEIKVNLEDTYGDFPLLWCCDKGDKSLGIAKLLLNHPKINVNQTDIWGHTPLIWCCKKGNKSLGIATSLLSHPKTDVNLQDEAGYSPLHECCNKGDKSLDIAELLLLHPKLKINLKDKRNYTPLDSILQFALKDEDYTYINLWNLLVANNAVLNKCKKAYKHLQPKKFKEPQSTYLRLIQQNPPKNINTNQKFMHKKEERKEE